MSYFIWLFFASFFFSFNVFNEQLSICVVVFVIVIDDLWACFDSNDGEKKISFYRLRNFSFWYWKLIKIWISIVYKHKKTQTTYWRKKNYFSLFCKTKTNQEKTRNNFFCIKSQLLRFNHTQLGSNNIEK